jgi:transcriptional regulator with XRE-family HTH domain
MLFKNYLKKNRWTYGSLAKEMNVSRVTIANWDKGTTSPTLEQTKKLVDLLGIEFIELLERGEKNDSTK